jgi:hypothetical protein
METRSLRYNDNNYHDMVVSLIVIRSLRRPRWSPFLLGEIQKVEKGRAITKTGKRRRGWTDEY